MGSPIFILVTLSLLPIVSRRPALPYNSGAPPAPLAEAQGQSPRPRRLREAARGAERRRPDGGRPLPTQARQRWRRPTGDGGQRLGGGSRRSARSDPTPVRLRGGVAAMRHVYRPCSASRRRRRRARRAAGGVRPPSAQGGIRPRTMPPPCLPPRRRRRRPQGVIGPRTGIGARSVRSLPSDYNRNDGTARVPARRGACPGDRRWAGCAGGSGCARRLRRGRRSSLITGREAPP